MKLPRIVWVGGLAGMLYGMFRLAGFLVAKLV